MYEIEPQEASPDFLKCWQAAGVHLDKQVDGGIKSWLRSHPYPPFLEHLSFRLGNQLFFVRIEDVDGKVEAPGSLRGLMSIADGCQGHPCIMPMKKRFLGGGWIPDAAGWGLLDARTKSTINPVDLVSDEKVEMTQWELQDFSVQVVRDQIEKSGYQLMSWQGNPAVDPSIWFVGESKRPEWVVVRFTKFPDNQARMPDNWDDIAAGCARMGPLGHFASVALVSVDQPFASENEAPLPLLRGHGMYANYQGLQKVD